MSCYRPLGVVEIRRATPDEFPIIADLARRIWPVAYGEIVGREQIDYMLRQRYDLSAMRAATTNAGLNFELLSVDGEPVGYAAHSPTPLPAELKLNQLYVLPDWQAQGLGGRLLAHVEAIARGLGRTHLVLTVNRHNVKAQAVYTRRGFVMRESVCLDIGNGYVMDDFVMQKDLTPAVGSPSLM